MFDRARYDAQRIIDRFAEGLRNEVDLRGLDAGILATAGIAVRPASGSVWIRRRELR